MNKKRISDTQYHVSIYRSDAHVSGDIDVITGHVTGIHADIQAYRQEGGGVYKAKGEWIRISRDK